MTKNYRFCNNFTLFYPFGLHEVVLHVTISKIVYFLLHFKRGIGNVILEFFSIYLSQN
jgi:hypothetical protein